MNETKFHDNFPYYNIIFINVKLLIELFIYTFNKRAQVKISPTYSKV